ncbi:MAG TPA: SRPBCC domain-containing protein, partial [Polyangiaceae bacterium]|nr:SRPBCC domain-containing protein [Polyangiaceae bacterium]
MSVKKDEAGRRYVAMEFEVPGTPEDVWQAIATGPGISAWFVPTEIEERVGGKLAFESMPGVTSKGHVTGWEPPRSFAYEEPEWSENAPPVATECIVEARGGGTCVVRMVHSLFTDKTDWDKEMEGFEAGWPPYFDVLRLYLTRFKGQRSSPLRLMLKASGDEQDAWQNLAGPLGLHGAAAKASVRSSGAAPELAGVIERTGSQKHANEVLLRVESPAPGAA